MAEQPILVPEKAMVFIDAMNLDVIRDAAPVRTLSDPRGGRRRARGIWDLASGARPGEGITPLPKSDRSNHSCLPIRQRVT
jgi:hypothetical protein